MQGLDLVVGDPQIFHRQQHQIDRLLAQVGLDDLGIVLDLLRRAFGNHFTEDQGLDDLAELHDHLHPVLDQKDGHAQLAHGPGG